MMTLVRAMKSKSRKVAGYVNAVLALEAIEKKRAERYDRYVRPLDAKRDTLLANVTLRAGALNGGQMAQAQRMLREIKGQAPAVRAARSGG